jgi:hypothetical protein
MSSYNFWYAWLTLTGVTNLMSGLLPHVQCGYTETSIAYACPHWPSANNDPRHHMAIFGSHNIYDKLCIKVNHLIKYLK